MTMAQDRTSGIGAQKSKLKGLGFGEGTCGAPFSLLISFGSVCFNYAACTAERFRSSADVFQVFVGLDLLMSERSWVNSLGP